MNRRSIQVRLNETVYVLRAQGDEHKKILKKLESHDKKKKDSKDEDEVPKQEDATYPPALYERKVRIEVYGLNTDTLPKIIVTLRIFNILEHIVFSMNLALYDV